MEGFTITKLCSDKFTTWANFVKACNPSIYAAAPILVRPFG